MDITERTNILLISVDQNNLSDLEVIAKIPDMYLFKAETLEDGFLLLTDHDFALILLNFGHKETEVIEIAEKIRNSTNFRTIPLFFIGAIQFSRKYLFNGYDAGAVDFLSRPFEKELLIGRMTLLIDFYKKNQSLKNAGLELDKAQDNLKTEIQKRKQTEIALRASKQQFKSLSENSPDIIYTLGSDGTFLYVNPAWKKILGHQKEEVLGKYFVDFVKEVDIQYFKNLFKQIRDERRILSDVTGTLIHENGSSHIFSLSGTPNINGDGDVVGMVGLLKDITQQQKLQAQLQHAQKMEAIGTLAGGVAHDFNNLLQAIHGYADLLLLTQGKDTPGYEELNEIKHITQRGAELTQQLLTFSRKVKSKLKPVDINNEIGQVKKLLERTIPKMIEIELDLTEDIRIINADPAQIEQVMMNLGVNARDAMPDGGKLIIQTEIVTLDTKFCSTHPGILPGNFILLTVADTGCGMDNKTQEHIFEPFFTTKTDGRGTGLGLSIIYGIIKSHGGYILCESKLLKGTTFKIYLPIPDQTPLASNSDRASDRISSKGTETVMLVDDDQYVRSIGEQILKRFGYTILTAANGESALELYRKKHSEIDLVILDLIMPGMGGKHCLEEIIKIKPQEKVIITTGYSFNKSEKKGILSKAKGFIDKPYESQYLLQRARTILDEM